MIKFYTFLLRNINEPKDYTPKRMIVKKKKKSISNYIYLNDKTIKDMHLYFN